MIQIMSNRFFLGINFSIHYAEFETSFDRFPMCLRMKLVCALMHTGHAQIFSVVPESLHGSFTDPLQQIFPSQRLIFLDLVLVEFIFDLFLAK